MVADDALREWTVVDHIGKRVDRSLVIADDAGPTGAIACSRRRAPRRLQSLPTAVAAWETLPSIEWLAINARQAAALES